MSKTTNISDRKKNKINSLMMKVAIILLAMLATLQIFKSFDGRSPIFREHNVNLFEHPIELPENYIVYDLSGRPVKLSKMIGGSDILVLPFWATWCKYCAQEFPLMDDVVPYLERHGVSFIPIARGDDTPNKVVKFFKRGNIKNMESVIASTPELHKRVGVKAYPTFILVNKDKKAFANMQPRWNSDSIFKLFEELRQKPAN